jgi:hypothetical protein
MAGVNGLDALLVYADLPGKHPLALLTHGTSRITDEQAHVTPLAGVASGPVVCPARICRLGGGAPRIWNIGRRKGYAPLPAMHAN